MISNIWKGNLIHHTRNAVPIEHQDPVESFILFQVMKIQKNIFLNARIQDSDSERPLDGFITLSSGS